MRAFEHMPEVFGRRIEKFSLTEDLITLSGYEFDLLIASSVEQACDHRQRHSRFLASQRNCHKTELLSVVLPRSAGRPRRIYDAFALPMPEQVCAHPKIFCGFSDPHGVMVVDFVSTRTPTVIAMDIVELNCGTLNMRGGEAAFGTDHFVCRVLLIKDGARLIAVDTGIGHAGIADPVSRFGKQWLDLARPALDPDETLKSQVTAHKRDPHSVTDVIVTHHHRDHVDGLSDFPWARIHAADECRNVVRDGGAGLVPAQWSHDIVWAPSPRPAPEWRGFATFTLDGLPNTIRLIALGGHAPGHVGVLVPTDDHLLLHVGDAFHHHTQLLSTAPAGVEDFARSVQYDEAERMNTVRKIATLSGDKDIRIVSSHDPREV